MAPTATANESPAPVDADFSMNDAADFDQPIERDENDPANRGWLQGAHSIKTLPGSSETAASFQFVKEDHTLGNALRYIIMKNPDVEFCGYSIPHPSEELMNIRIQTYEGTALDALEKGLSDLIALCDEVSAKYVGAREAFQSQVAAV
ncbi:hypothetical protein HYALB_00000604 [Hymenoscyphus albidus]|uniref:DNA-directed RNA polymerases I and III subunit RPAC2 n=1 Tax=Hymenoscyphus albidus TaxID=595503 RepID=A0A9N9LY44_9HELO|nr:hypothetical protein HYALB_00000604 [Hymenoscyphus albidus]